MFLLRFEGAAYWSGFAVIFLACAVWESFASLRELTEPAERRWRNHGILFALNAGLGALSRVGPLALGLLAAGGHAGPLSKPWAPLAVRCAIAVLLLDVVQFTMHWIMHHVPFLWRIHMVHHSDLDFDVSTTVRHHPLEVVFTQLVRLPVIAVLAPPAIGIFVSDFLSMALDLWTHSNASLPAPAEKLVKAIFVTPDMHRIHHSQELREQQQNLGQLFSWWDRLISSYAAMPLAKPGEFRTGVAGLEGQDSLGLAFMLTEPFHGSAENPDSGPRSNALDSDPSAG